MLQVAEKNVIDFKKLVSEPLGNGYPRFSVNGVAYASEGEKMIALMLHGNNIKFRPNPSFKLSDGHTYIPDFVLKFPFTWLGQDDDRYKTFRVLEAKNGIIHPTDLIKAKLLEEEWGLPVKLLLYREIKNHHKQGALPLELIFD